MALLTPESVYRRYETDGVPESGAHEPKKSEIIQLLNMLFGSSRGGWVVARTLSELNGITPENETDGGVVLTGSGAGYYDRDSGAWVFGRGFPDTFALLVDVGGTANAITASVSPGVDPGNVLCLLLPDPPGTNSSPAVTLTIDGVVHEVKSSSGNGLADGDIVEGVGTLFFKVGSEWRQLFSSASGATFDHQGDWDGETTYTEGQIVTGSNGNWYQLKVPSSLDDDPVLGGSGDDWLMILHSAALADGAVTEPKLAASLSSALSNVVATRAALRDLNTSRWKAAYLTEAGREGAFIWRAGNFSSNVAADTMEGIYIKADAVAATEGAWVRQFVGQVSVMWFGAGPAVADNTSIYNAIIGALPNDSRIFWPKADGVWKGHFIAPAGRSFKLELGGNTFSEVGQGYLFYMTGTAQIITTLTASPRVGQSSISVASAASIAVGDLLMLEDGLVRPSDSEKINQEILRVKGKTGTTVRIDDMVRSEQKVGTRNVYKITPVVGAEIRNGKAVIVNPWDEGNTSGNFSQPFRIDYSVGAVIADTEARNSYGQGANLRYAFEFLMERCKVFDAHNRELGGYGTQVYVGRKGLIKHIEARNARNGVDMSACYDVEVFEPDIDDCIYGIALAHNVTGGKITVVRPKIRNLPAATGSRAILTGSQNVGNQASMDYLLRDVTILDADIHSLASVTADTANLIFFDTSVANLKISGVTARFAATSTIANAATAIIRMLGQPFGICVIENVRTPPSYDGVDLFGAGYCVNAEQLAASLVSPYGVLIVKDCYNGFGQGVVYASGVRNVITENLTHGQAIGSAVRTVSARNGVTPAVDQSIGYHGRLS